jgi:hypothetical protein
MADHPDGGPPVHRLGDPEPAHRIAGDGPGRAQVWHEARFEEEDIENVANMASTDIVELLLNARMPPNRIIDWVDEAILYTYLGQGTSVDRGGEPVTTTGASGCGP